MLKRLLVPLLLTACNQPTTETVFLRTAEGVLPVVPTYRDDGWVLVHGDILVRADDFENNLVDPDHVMPDDAMPDADMDRRPYAGVRAVGAARWPNGRIPFRLHASLTAAQRTAVEDAIAHWEEVTSYRFVEPTDDDADFVTFVPGSGPCSSAIGRQGGEQIIEVVDCPWGRIAHEIGHTVGFFHEQSRLDRDTFVTIHWDNIRTDNNCPQQFETFAARGRDGQHIGPYDYGSIMHYGLTQCSDGTGNAITPKQSGVTIGQRNALSMWDRYAAEAMRSGWNMTGSTGPAAAVFRDANYGGVSQTFLPGHFRAIPTNNMLATVGDDQITSVIVPAGLSVRLCTGAGWPDYDVCQTLAGTTAQLPSTLDNRVSTVDVERAVTVYRGLDQTGVSQTFRVGTYAANEGELGTIGNDTISSLYVPPGLVAELCWSESGTGSTGSYCRTYEGNVDDVGDFMDNQTSLIRVKRAVTLYQEARLWGNHKTLVAGTHTSFAPVSGVSSLIVGDGLQARLCSNSDGSGTCAVFRGDVAYIGPGLNDRVRWVRVESNTTP